MGREMKLGHEEDEWGSCEVDLDIKWHIFHAFFEVNSPLTNNIIGHECATIFKVSDT